MSQLLLGGRKCLKRKHVELTVDQRLNLIRHSQTTPKPTLKQLSEQFGIGLSTVSDILSKKNDYIAQLAQAPSCSRQRLVKKSEFGLLNDALYEWFGKARSKGIPISGPLLQEKAVQLAQTAQIANFSASNGWLEKWKLSFNIKSFRFSGEKGDADVDAADEFKRSFPLLVAEYTKENIFNADEFGLLYRCLPDRTLAVAGSRCVGGKQQKDRVTVFIAASSTGEKLKPIVIGKAQRPRALKNANLATLPVIWYGNSTAWMTSDIFTEVINQIDGQMRNANRKILLFVDNCSSHCYVPDLTNVTVTYLPANTTSLIQPLDQGVISVVKTYYRKAALRHLLSQIEQFESATQASKSINIRDAISWLSLAWNSLEARTISGCFARAGFLTPEIAQVAPQFPVEVQVDDELPPLLESFQNALHITQAIPSEAFIEIDAGLPTDDPDIAWETSIAEHLLEAISVPPPPPSSGKEADSDDDDPETLPQISRAQATSALKELDAFVAMNCAELYPSFNEFRSQLEKKLCEHRAARMHQTSLTDFFSTPL